MNTMYERIKYPDGQISAKGVVNDNVIRERINTYEDLFFVKALSTLCRGVGKHLFIPCLFAQRSDRKFSFDQSFDLKIVCDFINSCGFTSIEVFDPHSDVALALLNNCYKRTSFEFVSKAAVDIGKSNLALVSPDAGAYKKVYCYAEELDLPLVAANKHRGMDNMPSIIFTGDVKNKDCLIVDDLCDGGYTFYALSKVLRVQGARKVYLYVSHGLFSKGFIQRIEPTDPDSSLQKCLDGIYCTNSVKDVSNDYYDGWRVKSLNNLVTQYKVI